MTLCTLLLVSLTFEALFVFSCFYYQSQTNIIGLCCLYIIVCYVSG